MINEKIKQLRESSNISQIELARQLNISRQALSHYEIGDRQPPIDILKKLCIIFDISADELLEIDNYKG